MGQQMKGPVRHLPAFGIAAVLVLSLVTAVVAPHYGDRARGPDGEHRLSRELRFRDMPDGGVEVTSGEGARVTVLEPGSNAFVRGALRALVRERRKDELGSEVPFRLAVWEDGRLTLDDPLTGESVDLRAFGKTNAEAFARILIAAEGVK